MASEIKLALVVNNTPATAGTGETQWTGGRGWFIVEGTWGGGNVVIQFKSPATGTYINIDTTNLTFTANGIYGFEAPPGELKAVITTATAVYVTVIGTRVS